MNITAKLYIDEVAYNALRFDFDLQKGADTTGKPSTKFIGGIFNFTIESTSKNDILEWSISSNMRKTIKLVISSIKVNGKSRELTLGDAFCLKYRSDFDAVNGDPMKEYFSVSPAYLLQNGQLIFEKYWKVTDLDNQQKESQENTQQKKKIKPKPKMD